MAKQERGYRKTYFDAHKSLTGLYRCVRCGRMFPKDEITVDHRIPKKLGGTDDISNLQAMCKRCNSSKNDNITPVDVIGTVIRSTANDTLGKTVKSAVVQNIKNALGIKYKRK